MARVLISIAALQVLTMLVALLRAKGLSVQLGPAGFGVVSTIDQVVTSLAQIGAFGLPFAALRQMSRAHSRGDAAFALSASSFLRMLIVLAGITTLLSLAASRWRPSLFGADLVPHRAALQVALLGIGATIVVSFLVNALASAQRAAGAALLQLCFSAAVAAAAVIGTYIAGPRGLYIGMIASGAVVIVAALAYVRRAHGISLSGRGIGLLSELDRSRDLVSSAASIYAMTAAYAISLLVVRYTVLHNLGEAMAGLLQASLGIALTVGALLMPMSSLHLAPMLNREVSGEQKVLTANRFALDVLLLLLLGALPVVLFPRLLLTVLYTSAFGLASATLGLFVLWQCLFQTANVYQQLLIGLGDTVFTGAAAVLSFGAAGLLAHLLVPQFGLAGAAAGLCISAGLLGAATAMRVRARYQLGVPATIPLRLLLVGCAVVAAGILFANEPELSVRGVLLRAGFALLTWFLLWWRLAADERARLLQLPVAALSAARVFLPGARAWVGK